jgi:hypothetical protein
LARFPIQIAVGRPGPSPADVLPNALAFVRFLNEVTTALEHVACPISWDDFDAVTGVAAAAELTRITQERHDIVHRGQKPYIKRALSPRRRTP